MTFLHCLLLLLAFSSLTSRQNYFLQNFCLQLRFPGYLIAVWRPIVEELDYCSGSQWACVYANNSVKVVQSAWLVCAILFSLESAAVQGCKRVDHSALANSVNRRAEQLLLRNFCPCWPFKGFHFGSSTLALQTKCALVVKAFKYFKLYHPKGIQLRSHRELEQ